MHKEYLSRNSVLFLLICLAAFLGYLRFQQYRQSTKIQAERNSLQHQIEAVEKKNREMEASIKYLSSLSSKEKVAREQLNLKKQGEKVFSFTQNESKALSLNSGQERARVNNPTKWWLYFTQ